MGFLAEIAVLDWNVVSGLLIAAGLVTIWISRPAGAAASLGASLGAPRPFDLGAAVASLLDPLRKLLAAAMRQGPAAIAIARPAAVEMPRARPAVVRVAAVAAVPGPRALAFGASILGRRKPASAVASIAASPPARLSIERQMDVLETRVVQSVNAARTSRELHRTAARQLDAADYALEQLRAELSTLMGGARKPAARPALTPLPRVVIRRPDAAVARRLAA